MDRPSDDRSSDFSDFSETPNTTTTISTVAVQAGKAKIVLAILRSKEWVRVRIQHMEPDLMEVGSSLEEARALRREHDELLMKLNLKQKDVTDLLARADDLAASQSQQEVYQAMADSLAEAWKDLNNQLEYRKMLLDQSISFHESALQFSEKMEQAQDRFMKTGVAQDVDSARRLLQQHQDMKKSILEASMQTLQEGQSLLDRIREMGMHADVQNRHATTAACYGIEHVLELLQDRRRHLEELWLQRRIKLEQCLQLLLLDNEVNKVSDWFAQTGDAYLVQTGLGDSLMVALNLQTDHQRFELQAREIQETVLRLVRTADQLVHSATYDAEGVRERLKLVDQKCENFMFRLDTRRKNLALAISFYTLAETALTKLDEIEGELNRTDLPRNSAALAEKHAQLSNAIVEVTTPALREGRILLERVGRDHPSVQGINNKVTQLQERSEKVQELCKARYEAGEKSQAFNQFQEKFAQLNSWLGQIGRATLSRYRDLGTDLNFARDFLEIHERLEKDARDKAEEVKALSTAAEDLVKSGDQESTAAVDQAKAFCEQWDQLLEVTQTRLRLARSYVSFHKKAQQLAISMDALEQYLKIEKLDASEVPDTSISHKETKYKEMSRSYSDVSSTGKAFIKQTEEVKVDQELETKRAVTVVEAILLQFTDRQFLITEYYEHWKVHVTTGKEFKTQWRQFIQDARKTIDWIMKEEKDFFAPFIAGHLGKTAEEAQQVKKKLEGFSPTIKKAQSEIEAHLKTAEMLSLKGDTRGQKDQIVNELLKIHTRFQARLNEYQVLINMTLKFFKNLSQLDKLIESTEKEFKAQELPKDVEKAEVMLKEHESSRIKIKELIDFSAEEGEQIVVRVRQQDSEAIAKDEVQKVLEMTESRRSTWERAWEEQRARLEQNFQISQFYFDLRQIHQELDELHRQLDSRHGNYGSSLSSVKMTSEAFRQFEASTQIIETKVKTFSKSSESLIRDQHYDSRRIRYEVDHVQKKWDSFLGRVSEYRAHLDESTKFFNLMDDSEEWIKSASQFLLLIGRKATECKTSADALDLIKQLEDFRAQGAQKQDDRLNDMYRLICTLYGQVDGPPKMQHVVDKNRTILESFLKAVQEMAILRDNLVKKEQIMAEVATVVETHAPKAPRFVQPLQNTEIAEGQRFTFECRIECDQMPKIEWFKEEMPITSPDYKQTYKDGVVTLTIEETFSADTAKYTCKATTQAGSTETSAQLTVRETYKKIEAPEFTKQLKAAEAPEGTQFMFECCVTGLPTPDISWYKNDVNVDNSPDFIITKINGTCCLKIRKLTKDHEAKYTCKATNKGGECGTTATLSVIRVVKPFFTVPLVNVTVQEGKTIRLECSFKAEPQPQIQWLKGDQLVTPSGIFKIIVEANMTALEINEVYPEDAGTYTVVARNIGGETRTQCVLGIEGMFSEKEASDIEPSKPRFVQGLKNKEVMEGNRARLDCVIVAQPEPEVIWYFNGRPVKESKDFQLLFEGDRCSLIIREVYLEDSGEYKCVAKNPHGFAESSCRLIVEPLSELSDASAASAPTEVVPPKFTQLLKDMEGIEGRQVRFECRVIGHPTPEVKWFRENQAIISSTDFQITVHRELHSLVIPEVFKEDAGNFMVRANNVAGEAKCYASLKIRPATEPHVVKTRLVEESHTVTRQTLTDGITHAGPEFRTMFKDMRVRAGESCTMQVIILGNPRPRVRWLFNNEPIVSPDYQIKAFGDNHSLFIPEVFEEDAGRFSIIAENESGKATCSALLEVVDESDAPPKPPSPAYVTTAPLMAPTATAPAMRQAPVTAPPPPQPAAPRMAPAPVQPVPPKPAPPQPPKQEVIAPIQVAPVAAAPPAPAPAPAPAPMKMEVEMPIPPKFLEPLKNISAEEGTRVMFEGFVQGKPEPTIKWYKAGNEVTNSPDFQVGFKNGRVSLTIPEVFEEDGGMYECQAKNEGGQVKSMAELVVKASMVPPQFAERLHSREVKEGNSVRFTVRVTGRPPPDVTWYREGSQIVSSPDFEIVKEGDVHSLYIPEAFYEDSGKFTICAENPAGKIEDTAELFVEAPTAPVAESASPSPPVSRSPSVGATPERSTKPIIPPAPPIFSAPLKDQKAREGDRVVLECVFPPYPQPERVQWFRNEVEVHSSPDYQISISNGIATMVIVEVFPEDAGEFSCVITINGVSAKTTMYLHVDAAPPSQPESTPQFDIQLTNQPLTFGQTAYFECKVSGNPPPEILWTRKGHPLVDKQRYKSTYDQYSGITTLTIIGLKEEDEGEYTCAAINSIGEASTTALLLGPERYANWQREQQAGRGRTPQKEKQRALLSELGQRMESPKPGTPKGHRAESPFKVSHFETRLMQEIAYREGRVDPHQLVTSPPADKSAFDSDMPLAQALPPRIEEPLKNFKLLEGQDVSFVGRVSGHPTPNIQWFHNGRLLKPGNRYEMKLTKDGYCSLRIRVAFPEDAGYYTLCATNIVGRETSSAELFIEALSKIDDTSYVTPETLRRLTRSPGSRRGSRDTGGVAEKYYKPVFRKVPADMEVREGEMVRFDCVVSGRPMPEIFWYLDGVQVHDDQLHKIVVNESGVFSLIIHATSRTDAGQYTCIARNRGGEDQFQVHLNVLAREAAATPRFIERLYNQTLREGQNAVFTCEATGVPVPMMSWQKDNKMLSQDQRHRIDTEGGRSTLMITDLRDVDNAWYQCSAVNIAGSASNRARLIVQAEPRKKEPERKLVITKRTTPTPQRDAQQRTKAPSPGRQQSKANINLTPSPAVATEQPVFVTPRADVQRPPPQSVLAPQGTRPAAPFKPEESPLVAYIREEDKKPARVMPTPDTPTFFDSIRTDSVASSNIDDILPDRITPMDLRDMATPSGTSPLPRPPTRELIKKGVEPAPSEDDMYNRDRPRPPKFKIPLKPQRGLMEAQPARFETRLVPIGDPTMKVEWFKDGRVLDAGHRFKITNDFGYVALDILYTYPEDNGTYKCIATNSAGRDSVETTLFCRAAMPVEPPVDRSMEPAAFQQPISSLNVEDGKSVRLEATVVGNPPPQVIWFKNGVQLYPSENIKITHETDKAVLIIVRAKPADSAVYTCRVMNPAGIAECAADVFVEDKTHAATAHLLLTQQQQTIQQQRTMQVTKPPPQAPIIIKAPSPLREVYAGNTTKIVVQLAAFPEPQFNWYHQGRVIEQSQRRKIMYEHGVVTLLIFNVQPQDSGEYMLRAMNPQGEVTWKTTLNIQASKKTVELPATQKQAVTIQSTSKTMTTQERTTIIRDVAPSFTHPLPKETTVNERSTARLEVFVDAIPQPRISWHFNGIELKPSIKYTISQEGKKSTLLIKNITSSDTGVYTCRAYSELGEAVSSTTVFVIPKEPTLGPEPPKFILPLQSCEAYDGEEVVLTCTVTGRPKPDIDWFHNQKNINKSEDFVISYNKETGKTDCVIVECLPDDQGTFKCVARNEAGQATTEATLQVRPPPPKPKKEPVIQPEMQVVVQTQMAPVQDSKVVRRQELQIDGENRLDTETVRTTETKTVTKIVKKSSGEPPRFTKPIQPQVVKEGENILFTAIVAGVPQPEITWLKDKKDMEPSPRIKTTFNPNTMETSMTITNATQQDIGVFSCRASNTAGRATCTANAVVVPIATRISPTREHLTVPSFSSELQPMTVLEGDSVTLTCVVSGQPTPDIHWFHNSKCVDNCPDFIITFDETTGVVSLTISETFVEDTGIYKCVASNFMGRSVTIAEVIVREQHEVSDTTNRTHLIQQLQIATTVPIIESGDETEYLIRIPVQHFTSKPWDTIGPVIDEYDSEMESTYLEIPRPYIRRYTKGYRIEELTTESEMETDYKQKKTVHLLKGPVPVVREQRSHSVHMEMHPKPQEVVFEIPRQSRQTTTSEISLTTQQLQGTHITHAVHFPKRFQELRVPAKRATKRMRMRQHVIEKTVPVKTVLQVPMLRTTKSVQKVVKETTWTEEERVELVQALMRKKQPLRKLASHSVKIIKNVPAKRREFVFEIPVQRGVEVSAAPATVSKNIFKYIGPIPESIKKEVIIVQQKPKPVKLEAAPTYKTAKSVEIQTQTLIRSEDMGPAPTQVREHVVRKYMSNYQLEPIERTNVFMLNQARQRINQQSTEVYIEEIEQTEFQEEETTTIQNIKLRKKPKIRSKVQMLPVPVQEYVIKKVEDVTDQRTREESTITIECGIKEMAELLITDEERLISVEQVKRQKLLTTGELYERIDYEKTSPVLTEDLEITHISEDTCPSVDYHKAQESRVEIMEDIPMEPTPQVHAPVPKPQEIVEEDIIQEVIATVKEKPQRVADEGVDVVDAGTFEEVQEYDEMQAAVEVHRPRLTSVERVIKGQQAIHIQVQKALQDVLGVEETVPERPEQVESEMIPDEIGVAQAIMRPQSVVQFDYRENAIEITQEYDAANVTGMMIEASMQTLQLQEVRLEVQPTSQIEENVLTAELTQPGEDAPEDTCVEPLMITTEMDVVQKAEQPESVIHAEMLQAEITQPVEDAPDNVFVQAETIITAMEVISTTKRTESVIQPEVIQVEETKSVEDAPADEFVEPIAMESNLEIVLVQEQQESVAQTGILTAEETQIVEDAPDNEYVEPIAIESNLEIVLTQEQQESVAQTNILRAEETQIVEDAPEDEYVEPIAMESNLEIVLTQEQPESIAQMDILRAEETQIVEDAPDNEFVEPIAMESNLVIVLTQEQQESIAQTNILRAEETQIVEDAPEDEYVEPIAMESNLEIVLTQEQPESIAQTDILRAEETQIVEDAPDNEVVEPIAMESNLEIVLTQEQPESIAQTDILRAEETQIVEDAPDNEYVEPIAMESNLEIVLTQEQPESIAQTDILRAEETQIVEDAPDNEYVEPIHIESNLEIVLTQEQPESIAQTDILRAEETQIVEDAPDNEFVEPIPMESNLEIVLTQDQPESIAQTDILRAEETQIVEDAPDNEFVEPIAIESNLEIVLTQDQPESVAQTDILRAEETQIVEDAPDDEFVEPIPMESNLEIVLTQDQPESIAQTDILRAEETQIVEDAPDNEFVEPIAIESNLEIVLMQDQPESVAQTDILRAEETQIVEDAPDDEYVEPMHIESNLEIVMTQDQPESIAQTDILKAEEAQATEDAPDNEYVEPLTIESQLEVVMTNEQPESIAQVELLPAEMTRSGEDMPDDEVVEEMVMPSEVETAQVQGRPTAAANTDDIILEETEESGIVITDEEVQPLVMIDETDKAEVSFRLTTEVSSVAQTIDMETTAEDFHEPEDLTLTTADEAQSEVYSTTERQVFVPAGAERPDAAVDLFDETNLLETSPGVTAAEGLEATANEADRDENEAFHTMDTIEDTDMADQTRPVTNIDKVKDVLHMEAGPEESPAEGLESTATVPELDENDKLTTIETIEDNAFGDAHRPETNIDKVKETEHMEIGQGESAAEGIESALNVPEVQTGEALGTVDCFYDSDRYNTSRPSANVDKVKEFEQMEVAPGETPAEHMEPVEDISEPSTKEVIETIGSIEDTVTAESARPDTSVDKVQEVNYMESAHHETVEDREVTTEVPELDSNEVLTSVGLSEQSVSEKKHRPDTNVDKVGEIYYMETTPAETGVEEQEATGDIAEVVARDAFTSTGLSENSVSDKTFRPVANIDKVAEDIHLEVSPAETAPEEQETTGDIEELNAREVFTSVGLSDTSVSEKTHRPALNVDKVAEDIHLEVSPAETAPEEQETTEEVSELVTREVITSVGLSEKKVSEKTHRPAANIDKVGELIEMEVSPGETAPEEQETTSEVAELNSKEALTSVGLSENSVSEKTHRPATNIDKVGELIQMEVSPGETAPEEQESTAEVAELNAKEALTSVGLSEHSVSEKTHRPAANIDKVGELIQMEVSPGETAPEEQESIAEVAELNAKEALTSVGLSEQSVSEKTHRPAANIDKVAEVIHMEASPGETAIEEQESTSEVAELNTKEVLTSVGLSEHSVSEKTHRPAANIDKVGEVIHMETTPGETAIEEQEATGDVPEIDTKESFASVGQSAHNRPEKTHRPLENIDKVVEVEYMETTPAETAKEEQETTAEVPQLDDNEVITSVGVSEKSASIKTQRPAENIDKVQEIIDMETSPHESGPVDLEATAQTEVEFNQPLTTVEPVDEYDHGTTIQRAPGNTDQQKKLEETFTAFEERGPSPDLIYEDIPTLKEGDHLLSLQSIILDTFAKQQQEVETQEQVYPEQPVGDIGAEVPEEQAGESQLPIPAPEKFDTGVLPTETELLKKFEPTISADVQLCPSPDLIFEYIPGLLEDDIIKTQQEVLIVEPFAKSQQEVESQEQVRPDELIDGIGAHIEELASESQLPVPEPERFSKDVLPTETLEHMKLEFTMTGHELKCASPDIIYEILPAFTAMETLKTWQDAMVVEPFAKDQQIVAANEQIRPHESLHDITAEDDSNADEYHLPVPEPERYYTDVLPTESREENKLEMTFVPDELSCPSPDYIMENIPLMKETETVQSEQEVILVEPIGRSQTVVETREQVRPHESLHDLTAEASDEEADMSQLPIPAPETFAVGITPMVTSEQVRPDEYLGDISADDSEGEADVFDLPVPAPETIAIDVVPTVSLEQTRPHESIGDIPAEVSDEEALVSEREGPEEEDLGIEMTLCAVNEQVRPDESLAGIEAEASDEEAYISEIEGPEAGDLGVEMTMCTVDVQVRPEEVLAQIEAELSDEEAQISELDVPFEDELGVEMTMCAVDVQMRPEELLTDIEAELSDEEAEISEMEWLEPEELGIEMTMSTVDVQMRQEEMLSQLEAEINEEEANMMMIPIPHEEGFYVALIPTGAKEQMRPDEILGMIKAEVDEEEAWISEREMLEEEDFEISMTLSGVKEQLGREELIADVPETVSPDLAEVGEMPAIEGELEIEMTMSKTNEQIRANEEQLANISPEVDSEEGMIFEEEEMFDSESDWIEVKRQATNAREQKKTRAVEAVFHEDVPEELGTEVTDALESSQPLISRDEKVNISTSKQTLLSLANLQKTQREEEEESRLSSPDFLESEMIIEDELPRLELVITEPEIKTLEMTTLVIPAKEKLEVQLRQELEEVENVKPYFKTTRKELFQMMKDLGPQERYRMEMKAMIIKEGRVEITWQPEDVKLQPVPKDEEDFVKVKRHHHRRRRRRMVDSSIQVETEKQVSAVKQEQHTLTETERALMMARRDEAYIENYQSSMFIPKKEKPAQHVSTFIYKKEKPQQTMHSSALVMRTKKTAELKAIQKDVTAQHTSSLVVQKIKEKPKSHMSTVLVKRDAVTKKIVQMDIAARRQATHTNTLLIKGKRPTIQFDTGEVITDRRTERMLQARQDMLAVFERQQQTARHTNTLVMQRTPKLPTQTFVFERTQRNQGYRRTLEETNRLMEMRRRQTREYQEEQPRHSTTYIVEARKPQQMSIFTQYMDQQQYAMDWRRSHLSVYDRMVRPPTHYSTSLLVQRQAPPMRMLEIPIEIQVISRGGRARSEMRRLESSWESRYTTTRREVRSRSSDRFGPMPMNYGTTLIIEIHTYPTYSPAYIHTVDFRDREQSVDAEERRYHELMIQSSQSALMALRSRREMRELTPTTRQNIMMIQSGQTKVIPIVITVYVTTDNWRSSTTNLSTSYETITRRTTSTTSEGMRPVLRTYGTPMYVECPRTPTMRPTITIEITTTTPGSLAFSRYGSEFQRYALTRERQIITPPNFPDPIEPQVVMFHGAAVFIGYITGIPQPEIKWYWRKRLVTPKPGGRYRTYYERDTGRVELVIMDVRAEDFGEITCEAVNPGGRATCSANLIVVKKYFAKDYGE